MPIKSETTARKRSAAVKIAVLSAAHLFHDIYTSFLSPILPLLIEKLALSYAAAGCISVIIRVPSLFSPLVGAVLSRRTMKAAVIVSPAVTAAAMCLMGTATSYYLVAVLALVAGISSTCFHVPSPVLIHESAGSRTGSAMSAFQIGGELSRTVGPIVVLAAVSVWSLDGLYRLIPFGLAASVFLYVSLGGFQPHEIKGKSKARGRVIDTFRSARFLFAALFGILLCKSFSASVLAAYLPTYLKMHTGKSLWVSGSALALLQGAGMAGVFLSGTLSDKLGCERILLILTCSAPAGMLLFVFTTGWATVFCLVLLGLTAFSSTPVLLSLIQKKRFSSPATANGIYMTMNFLLGALTVMFAGFLSDTIGIAATFRLSAYASWIGVPFVVLLYYKNRSAGIRPKMSAKPCSCLEGLPLDKEE